MAEQSDDNFISNGEVFTVNDFVECFELPKWAEVVGGTDLEQTGHGSCNIEKGMVLLFRTLAVDKITLSFNDADTGVKRLVQVSPDTKVKFKVLLPFPDFKNPHMPRTIYETVNDLLKVCPTCFKTNAASDSSSSVLFKEGDVFRFIRQTKHASDKQVYMQCEDSDGNLIELPGTCVGDFTAVEDDRSYTLKEILDLGLVDRKLKLSHEHIGLELAEEQGEEGMIYTNLIHSDGKNVLQRIMGLPFSYTGMLSFHKPTMFLVASPSDRQNEIWKIPLTAKMNVKEFKEDDYEKPTTAVADRSSACNLPPFKLFKLSELLDTYHEQLPVLATLVHYKDTPEEFVHSLIPGCDVIIHNIEHCDRILGKSGELHFAISRQTEGRFRRTLKKFISIPDLKAQLSSNLTEEICVRVQEEIACDFPVPYSLLTGDILRFKTLTSKMHKVKTKAKSYGTFPVVHCEKQKESGSFEKILLPEDLEITMHEMPSRSKAEGFSAEEIFRFKPTFPFSVNFLPDYVIWSCLPVNCEIQLTHFVTESVAIISPVPKCYDSGDIPIIDNRVRDCLLVPVRHHVMLTVKDCLGFPPGYFKFPDRSVYLHCPVEKIDKQVYDQLVHHNDVAYEDYGGASQVDGKSEIHLPKKAPTEHNYAETFNKRLSKSLNMFKNKSTLFHKLKLRKSIEEDDSKPEALAVENETYQAGSSHGDDEYADENIYESVNVGGK